MSEGEYRRLRRKLRGGTGTREDARRLAEHLRELRAKATAKAKQLTDDVIRASVPTLEKWVMDTALRSQKGGGA